MHGLPPGNVAAAVRLACRFDVLACKPGNVSIVAAGHAMSARDFLTSAAVVSPLLANATLSLGAGIRNAVEATVRAVGCNTNLGIVLLAAPLAHAALRSAATPELRSRVAHVLAGSDLDDSRETYAAIRLASPAGLGQAAAQDVHAAPTVPLQQVMALAAARDRIAYQYAHDFADVFGLGVTSLRHYRDRWDSLAWAMVGCYLRFMAEFDDSHIVRKHGAARAETVRARAREVETAFKACENPGACEAMLEDFDRELKRGGVNPGTSADLTVASLLALLLEAELKADSTRCISH